MRRLYLMVACVLGAAACSPLRQPLGSLAAVTTTGGAGAAGTSGAGASAGAGTLTGNQIPSLPPDWNQPSCDPTVFRCFEAPGSSPSSPASALFGGTPDPDPTSKPVIVYPLDGAMHPIN